MASLATVVPTTALTSASGNPERTFLAERFQIETIVTSHDPKRVNFSENTSIHESLIVARRPGAERAPTRFISLARMPQDTHEAILLSDLINHRQPLGSWGTEHSWPWPRMREGDWSAAQFYDGALADAITILRRSPLQCSLRPESSATSNQADNESETLSYEIHRPTRHGPCPFFGTTPLKSKPRWTLKLTSSALPNQIVVITRNISEEKPADCLS